MPTDEASSEDQQPAKAEKKPGEHASSPGIAESEEKTAEPIDEASMSGMEASFWDESQIQAVVRHAGANRRSPEEFFNKKWKDRLIHGKKDPRDGPAKDEPVDEA